MIKFIIASWKCKKRLNRTTSSHFSSTKSCKSGKYSTSNLILGSWIRKLTRGFRCIWCRLCLRVRGIIGILLTLKKCKTCRQLNPTKVYTSTIKLRRTIILRWMFRKVKSQFKMCNKKLRCQRRKDRFHKINQRLRLNGNLGFRLHE